MNRIRISEAIFYKCIYCGEARKYSSEKLFLHLTLNHDHISELDKKELLKDLELKLLRKDKQKGRKLALKKAIENNKVETENKIKELENKKRTLFEFKKLVVTALEGSYINQKIIETIKSRRNIEKVKMILMFGLKKEFQTYLDKVGIDYFIEPQKKDKKLNRMEIEKEYYDRTQSSVNAIYTPMGNKK